MTLSSWHFCTLHRFSFLLDSKKREEKKTNEDQGAEAFYSDDACKISRDMNRWKSEKRHAGSRFRLHFYILKGKNTAISLEQKKRTKPNVKCKPKKRPHFSDHMHAEYLKSLIVHKWSLSLSTNLCFLTNAVRSFKGKPSYECRWGQGKKKK